MLGKALRRRSPGLHSALLGIRNRDFEILPPRRTYAEHAVHRVLKTIFRGENGYFVEAGASDGVRRSNTLYLERHCGWIGILIESIPHRAVECMRNRPKSSTEHCALVAPSYPRDYVELIFQENMSFVNSSENALSPDTHISNFKANKKHSDPAWGVKFLAPARTLESVLSDYGHPAVDLLSLDVEGFEMEALKGLDFGKCAPRFILIEDWDRSGIRSLLSSCGYKLRTRIGYKNALYEAQ